MSCYVVTWGIESSLLPMCLLAYCSFLWRPLRLEIVVPKLYHSATVNVLAAFLSKGVPQCYSGPCILRPPIQPAKYGLKLKVVLKQRDIQTENIQVVPLISSLKMQGIVKQRGLKSQGPLQLVVLHAHGHSEDSIQMITKI